MPNEPHSIQYPDPELAPPALFPVGKTGTLHALRTTRFKSARLSLFTVLPLTRKTAVLAPLMLSVLRRGCQGYPSLAHINRRLDDLWGSSIRFRDFSFGDRKLLGLTLEFVDPSYLPGQVDLLPDLLDLVQRILFCPLTNEAGLLDPAMVAREKDLQCDEIRALVTNPAQYAAEHAGSFFFGSRPAGIPPYGSVEETQAVTPEELTAYWQAWRQNFAFSFFYIGATDPALVAKKLNAAFGPLCTGKPTVPTSFLDAPPPLAAKRARKREECLAIGQGHLILGFHTGGVLLDAPQSIPLQVAKEILGGSPISLLFMSVREKLSLCYSVSAYCQLSRAALFVQCALNPENRKVAEREILRQIDRLKQGDFSDVELDAARKSLIFYYRTLSDNPGSLELFWVRKFLTGNTRTPNDTIAALAATRREEVVATANLLSLNTVYFLRGTAREEGPNDEI